MPAIGSQIKPFFADAFCNGSFLKISDADLYGKWSVIFFYPADFTSVCPTELEELAEYYETFQKMGVEIYSVSTDKHFTHKAWHESSPAINKVKYIMVGDPSGMLARNFDAMPADGSYLAQRATFLIDPEGRIQYIEVTSRGMARSTPALLEKIEAAQYIATHPGESCPAKWKPPAPGSGSIFLNLTGKL